MPKIPEIHPAELIKILCRIGFTVRHGKGSHKVLTHTDGRRTVVPNHNRPVRIGTLKAILRQVKIMTEDFLALKAEI